MRLDTFLLRLQWGDTERPEWVSEERWAAMLRWVEVRRELGEPFDWYHLM